MTTKKPMSVAERSAVLRERVRDHLARTGGRRGKMVEAKEDFVHAVIRCGRANEMRLWKSDKSSASSFHLGMQSLDTLLEEKSVYNPTLKVWNTGRNVHWVLDLWETTLDSLNRSDVFAAREKPEDALKPDEAVDREDDGVRVSVGRAKKLSMRVIEAYLARDEDAIMEIAAEVEALESSAR